MADVILGIMKKSVPARHPIQNKFARLHGCIVECKERDKRAFTHASALNFTGSISPVRLPEFEIDLDKLSRLSSPIGMQEIAGKYENIEELRVNEDREFERAMQGRSEPPEFDTCNYNPYDHDLIPDDYAVTVEQKKRIKSVDENDQQTNFPAVISPMKRPQKDIEADGNFRVCEMITNSHVFFSFCITLPFCPLHTAHVSHFSSRLHAAKKISPSTW